MPIAATEMMRLATERFNAGDLDGFADLLDPDATITPDPSWPEPGPFEGREAVMEFVRGWVAPWESVRLELDELEERGGGVVSRCRWLTRGKASGAATVVPFTFLGAARGGHLAELRAFFDHDAALRSLD